MGAYGALVAKTGLEGNRAAMIENTAGPKPVKRGVARGGPVSAGKANYLHGLALRKWAPAVFRRPEGHSVLNRGREVSPGAIPTADGSGRKMAGSYALRGFQS